jgi:large subunit ribosomal protein L35
MPKLKTHKGIAKRIKITKSGKLKRRRSSRSHLREKKSAKTKRRYRRMEDLSNHDKKAVKKLLPYGS